MYHQATEIKRELLQRVCELCFEEKLVEEIDRIPLIMRPKGNALSRCCIHKDRAVIKYRLMTILGFNVSDETDELTTLSEYAKKSLERKEFTDVMLTVVDEACSSCVKNNYTVTNICRACVGHPCTYACNKDAISIDKYAEIDHSKCVNCGRCMDACRFHAIVYTPVPCEEVCPTGAISKNSLGIEHIDWSKCIFCGRCSIACPYGAIMEKPSFLQIIRDILNPDKRVVAMVAPAIAGQYKTSLPKILGAIKSCGFDEVVEVALGANITSKNEAKEWQERVLYKGEPFMTTSCCPSYKEWAVLYLPELVPYISHTATPASYTADLVKNGDPDAITVFIGPCMAKRVEGFYDPNVDYVMTFEELDAMIGAKGIDVLASEDYAVDEQIDRSSRQYARTGGVSESVAQYVSHPEFLKASVINGLNKESIKLLKAAATSGSCEYNLLEVMMCEGGCVSGCGVLVSPKIATRQLMAMDKGKI